jgi:hypothetical protein
MAKQEKKARKRFCVSAGAPGFFSDNAKPRMRIYQCFTTQKAANAECRNLRRAGKKCKVIVNKHAGLKCCSWRKKCR